MSDAVSTVVVRRRTRVPSPPLPEGELAVEQPPEIPASGTWLVRGALFYLPVVSGAATGALLLLDDSSTRIRLVAAMLVAISVVGGLVGIVGSREQRRTAVRVLRHDYLRYLAHVDERMRRAGVAQRQSLAWRFPRPAALWSLAMGRRLWERRPFDGDFLHIRIAVGAQSSAVTLTPPETAPVEDLDPVCAEALRGMLRTHSTIAELPVALALQSFARVTFTGDAERIRGLACAMAAQLAVFHAPADVRISVCTSSALTPYWDWIKWLPHALHPTEQDAVGPVRLITRRLADLEALLGDEFQQRPRFDPSGAVDTESVHHVVIVDGGLVDAEAVLSREGLMGVTVLDLGGDPSGLTGEHTARLHVTEEGVRYLRQDPGGQDAATVVGRPDFLTVEQAGALARQLAPLRVDAPLAEESSLGGVEVPLTRLLDVSTLASAGPPERSPRHRLRIPIGLDTDGRPVELDLKEAAQLGMGPHGLAVGATGSGKSELLRTIILGLAATHGPETLNLVLVDFKGAATFLGFQDLPQVSALVTRLEEDPSLIDRLYEALHGEVVRRQGLLKAAGNYASARDYERAREEGADLAPLPSMFVVIDEFSELLTVKPEFTDLLVMIGRMGRSLGIHMLLASQRLEEGRLRGLDTHLSYRIGLRTFSAMESRAVLGVPDAYELPPRPGWAFLRVGTDRLVRFRAAYVSGPAAESALAAPGSNIAREIQPFVAEYVRPEVIDPDEEPEKAPERAPEHRETLLHEVVGRLADRVTSAHRIWLPPLDVPPTLDELIPEGPAGWSYDAPPGDAEGRTRIAAPVGIVDRPFDHRRELLWLDLSTTAGSVGVVGGPQSGKSTMVRTLIASVALQHTPDEVWFYCLDFGGGTLASLAALPHVGDVASRRDVHKVHRTVAEVAALLERRVRDSGKSGIESGGAFHPRAADPPAVDDFADVFLVIDGWSAFRQDYAQLEPVITDLASHGPGYGIHVVVTATTWPEFQPAVHELLGTRLELRLGDPHESEIDRRLARNVPADKPGRGLTSQGDQFLAALPRIDGDGTVRDLDGAVGDLVEIVRDNWRRPGAPPIKVFPERLPATALPGPAGTPLIPIGIDEDHFGFVQLDFATEPHFAVFGDPGCGKTNLLRLIAQGVIARHGPEKARLAVIDYQSSLADLDGTEHCIGYATSARAAAPLVADIREVLLERIPPTGASLGQLRSRSWWKGADLYLFVDDYELLDGPQNPLLPLVDLLLQARDIGFHLVISQAVGGSRRTRFQEALRPLDQMGAPLLLMAGSTDEDMPFDGARPGGLRSGQGWLLEHGRRTGLVQVAYTSRKVPPADD